MRELNFVYCYLDNILIASESREMHTTHVRLTLERLYNAGLTINASKREYTQTKMPFLGYVINSKGIRPASDCVQPILDYGKLVIIKELHRFLGLINFYRRGIPEIAEIQARLRILITLNKKNDRTPVAWTADAEEAFTQLKQAVHGAVLLAHPDPALPIVLCCNASSVAIGGALHQVRGTVPEPLSFFSRKLTETEKKYSTYDRELLAVFAVMGHFRTQIEGREFCVYTDHKPLVYAFRKNNENRSPRQIRQLDFISQFTTDIRYIQGCKIWIKKQNEKVKYFFTSTLIHKFRAHSAANLVSQDRTLNFYLANVYHSDSTLKYSQKLVGPHLHIFEQPIRKLRSTDSAFWVAIQPCTPTLGEIQ